MTLGAELKYAKAQEVAEKSLVRSTLSSSPSKPKVLSSITAHIRPQLQYSARLQIARASRLPRHPRMRVTVTLQPHTMKCSQRPLLAMLSLRCAHTPAFTHRSSGRLI